MNIFPEINTIVSWQTITSLLHTFISFLRGIRRFSCCQERWGFY